MTLFWDLDLLPNIYCDWSDEEDEAEASPDQAQIPFWADGLVEQYRIWQ